MHSQYAQQLALNPRDHTAYYGLGALAHQAGDHGQAELNFLRSIALAPKHASSLNVLGVLRRESHRLPEALAAFRRAVRAAPRDELCRYNFATGFAMSGMHAEA